MGYVAATFWFASMVAVSVSRLVGSEAVITVSTTSSSSYISRMFVVTL